MTLPNRQHFPPSGIQAPVVPVMIYHRGWYISSSHSTNHHVPFPIFHTALSKTVKSATIFEPRHIRTSRDTPPHVHVIKNMKWVASDGTQYFFGFSKYERGAREDRVKPWESWVSVLFRDCIGVLRDCFTAQSSVHHRYDQPDEQTKLIQFRIFDKGTMVYSANSSENGGSERNGD